MQRNNKYLVWANKGGRFFENCFCGCAVSMFLVSRSRFKVQRFRFNVSGLIIVAAQCVAPFTMRCAVYNALRRLQ
jgi:hypothetical protein